MKKSLVILLATTLAFSLTACGNKETTQQPQQQEQEQEQNQEQNQDQSQEQQQTEAVAITDPVELLTTVWDSYADDDKFAVAGGDMSEENMTMDGPGRYGIEDAELVDNSLGFPAADIDQIDDAASLTHMMNANTFTAGAYHVVDSTNIATVAADVKENILNRQWICGFPDKVVIASVGNYVVAFFGENGIVDTFKTQLTEVYPTATIISEDPIA